MAAKRTCKGKTKKGKPCGAAPLKPGTVLDGVSVSGNFCRQHDPDLPDSARIGGAQPGAGRPRVPTTTEVLRQIVTDHAVEILRPHFRVLGYELEVKPQEEDGKRIVLVPLKGGGAKLHGESREGVVKMSEHEDLGAQMAAAEKLLDRALGRPKQSTELTGAGGGPVEIVPVTREKAKKVGGILAGVGAGGG